jgi:hypothetical protein
LTKTKVSFPADFIISTEVIGETPSGAYRKVIIAVVAGIVLFVCVRFMFADLCAMILLSPLYVFGLFRETTSSDASTEDAVGEGGDAVGGVAEAPGSALEGVGEAAADIAGGASSEGVAAAAAGVGGAVDGLGAAAEGVGGVLEGVGETAGEALDGCGGCLGSLFG